MGEYVRVESVEALKKFRVALCKFVETVQVSLGEAEAEIQRTSFWLKQEQHNHWKRQVEQRAELYAQAKSALNRKKMQKTPLGGRYSYIEEEKALAAAKRQLEEARQKQANVRRWSRLLDEESFSYMSVAQGMNLAVEVETPSALAHLDNMIAAIEAYAASGTPSEQRSTAMAPTPDDISRPEEFVSVARDTPPAPRATAKTYQRLRAQTPSQAVRDGVSIAKHELHWSNTEDGGLAVRDVLADLNLARVPIAAGDKIVLAREAWQHQRIFLERVESATAGDSGWYVGFADGTEVSGYEAVRIGDLLAGRPDLKAALELPVGYLVVLDGPSLEAVLDPRGRLLWPSQTPMQ